MRPNNGKHYEELENNTNKVPKGRNTTEGAAFAEIDHTVTTNDEIYQ